MNEYADEGKLGTAGNEYSGEGSLGKRGMSMQAREAWDSG